MAWWGSVVLEMRAGESPIGAGRQTRLADLALLGALVQRRRHLADQAVKVGQVFGEQAGLWEPPDGR